MNKKSQLTLYFKKTNTLQFSIKKSGGRLPHISGHKRNPVHEYSYPWLTCVVNVVHPSLETCILNSTVSRALQSKSHWYQYIYGANLNP